MAVGSLIANKDGEVAVLKQGGTKTVLARNTLPDPVQGSMVTANGVLYLTTNSHLYAIGSAGKDLSAPGSQPSAR